MKAAAITYTVSFGLLVMLVVARILSSGNGIREERRLGALAEGARAVIEYWQTESGYAGESPGVPRSSSRPKERPSAGLQNNIRESARPPHDRGIRAHIPRARCWLPLPLRRSGRPEATARRSKQEAFPHPASFRAWLVRIATPAPGAD